MRKRGKGPLEAIDATVSVVAIVFFAISILSVLQDTACPSPSLPMKIIYNPTLKRRARERGRGKGRLEPRVRSGDCSCKGEKRRRGMPKWHFQHSFSSNPGAEASTTLLISPYRAGPRLFPVAYYAGDRMNKKNRNTLFPEAMRMTWALFAGFLFAVFLI